ncbi:uncharacterized protein MONBRDRAFT_31509 [Monosiga brevicollis MX1]|uniref:Importin N-terminal domain-containing protein n=1 Tax=Monosiga brevicollis TaxID=81824 RepID=A9UTN3_MONBE|nr:uncharacterized protein MONBRDRAFT_31509 [Monosiga brevicollis MX1]EDQ91523.1 predicted protein [Monosiga brevicollis MX1]|eukprot:XP_001743945.1 hypothetical protein [Monosiga brevicollis MX1]
MNPAASSLAKQQALQYCDEFKATAPACPRVGLYLASIQEPSLLQRTHDPTIRFFGLQLLLHCIQYRWNDYQPEEKEEMKTVICSQLLVNGTLPLGEEQTFVLLKVGSVVAKMATREWPQQWPALIPQLLRNADESLTARFLSMACLKSLIEDTNSFNDDLLPRRRKELTQGLTACLDEIIPFATTTLAGCLAQHSQHEGLQAEQYELTLGITLETWIVLVEWIPFEKLFASGVLPLFCQLLHVERHRQLAADALLIVMNRKGPKHDRLALLDLFQHMDVLLQAVPQWDAGGHAADEEAYNFIKRLAQIVVALATDQLCPLWSRNNGPYKHAPPTFESYLSALIALTRHPSELVCSLTVPAWMALLNHDDACREKVLQDVQPYLLHDAFLRLMRGGGLEEDDSPGSEFAQQDFGDQEEYKAFFGLFRGKLLDVVRAIGRNQPAASLEFALNQLSVVMSTPPDSVDGRVLFNSWDGIAVFWDAIVAVAYPTINGEGRRGRNEALIEQLKNCLAALLDWSCANPLLMEAELTVLGALLPVLEHAPQALRLMLEKLFNAMEYQAQEDYVRLNEAALQSSTHTGLTDGAKVRRKAGQILKSLCQRPPPSFTDTVQGIIGRVQQLLSQVEIGEMQRRLLIEALVVSFNSLGDDVQEQSLLGFFQPILAEWCHEENTRMLSSVNALIGAGGLNSGESYPQAQATRLRLTMSVNAFLSAVRDTAPRGSAGVDASTVAGAVLHGRASSAGIGAAHGDLATLSGLHGDATGGNGLQYPALSLLHQTLPNVLRLCNTLHHLEVAPAANNMLSADPSTLPPGMAVLLDLRRSDVHAILAASLDSASRDMTAQELWMDRARLWLFNLRESCYRILGCTFRYGVLYGADDQAVFQQACVEVISGLRKRDLRLFWKLTVYPFLRYLPRDPTIKGHAVQTAAAIILQTCHRLSASMLAAQQGTGGSTGPRELSSEELTPEQREILEEKLDVDLMETVIITLDHLTADVKLQREETIEDKFYHQPELGPSAWAILADHSCGEALLVFLCQSLAGRHASQANKACATLLRLVPALASHDVYSPGLATLVPSALLDALAAHGEHHDNLTNLLLLAGKCLLWLGVHPACQSTFMTVPDINADHLMETYNMLQNRELRNTKPIRLRMKSLLDGTIGVNVGQVYNARPKVLDLPQKLVLARQPTADEDDDPDLQISALFDE